MHYLHRILVNVAKLKEQEGHKPGKEDIRYYAESITEDYYRQAFDWRETESAGRWQAEYPKQVYFASKDIEWFVNELKEVITIQKDNIDFAMEQLRATCGTDLDKIIESLWRFNDGFDNQEDGTNDMIAYYLNKIAHTLHGNYEADSCFYNSDTYSARLYQSDIDEVIKKPQNWALVMFDYHN